MNDDRPGQRERLEDIYALIDNSRAEAARAARAKFHNEMEAAMAAITSIGSIAGARVLADSRVASANVLINAELAATRLLAEAEMQASRAASEVLTKPRAAVEAALLEIGKQTSLQLVSGATEAVERIQRDAEASIQVLRETSGIAIREIQALAATVAEQTRHDAALAAERLREYRNNTRTAEEVESEGLDAAQIVIQAAEEASGHLQGAIKRSMAQMTAITEEACSLIREASLAAEKTIQEGLEKALIRLQEALRAYL